MFSFIARRERGLNARVPTIWSSNCAGIWQYYQQHFSHINLDIRPVTGITADYLEDGAGSSGYTDEVKSLQNKCRAKLRAVRAILFAMKFSEDYYLNLVVNELPYFFPQLSDLDLHKEEFKKCIFESVEILLRAAHNDIYMVNAKGFDFKKIKFDGGESIMPNAGEVVFIGGRKSAVTQVLAAMHTLGLDERNNRQVFIEKLSLSMDVLDDIGKFNYPGLEQEWFSPTLIDKERLSIKDALSMALYAALGKGTFEHGANAYVDLPVVAIISGNKVAQFTLPSESICPLFTNDNEINQIANLSERQKSIVLKVVNLYSRQTVMWVGNEGKEMYFKCLKQQPSEFINYTAQLEEITRLLFAHFSEITESLLPMIISFAANRVFFTAEEAESLAVRVIKSVLSRQASRVVEAQPVVNETATVVDISSKSI